MYSRRPTIYPSHANAPGPGRLAWYCPLHGMDRPCSRGAPAWIRGDKGRHSKPTRPPAGPATSEFGPEAASSSPAPHVDSAMVAIRSHLEARKRSETRGDPHHRRHPHRAGHWTARRGVLNKQTDGVQRTQNGHIVEGAVACSPSKGRRLGVSYLIKVPASLSLPPSSRIPDRSVALACADGWLSGPQPWSPGGSYGCCRAARQFIGRAELCPVGTRRGTQATRPRHGTVRSGLARLVAWKGTHPAM